MIRWPFKLKVTLRGLLIAVCATSVAAWFVALPLTEYRFEQRLIRQLPVRADLPFL